MSKHHTLSRRGVLLGAGVGAGLIAAPTFADTALAGTTEALAAPPSITDPSAALHALLEGNQRWQSDTIKYRGYTKRRMQLGLAGQTPFAVVLGCIDSRVPPEIIFDQDVNDLFDVRTAGEVLAPVVVGSIEYGPITSDTPLILVLGHQNCGAVKAAVQAFRSGDFPPDSIKDVVFALQPAYAMAKASLSNPTEAALIEATTRWQVQLTVEALSRQAGLGNRIGRGVLRIVGGYYTLETGAVELVAPSP